MSEQISRQFELWLDVEWAKAPREKYVDGSYRNENVQRAWVGWQAAASVMQPAWNDMSVNPPFPFTGDIFSEGRVLLGAHWAAGYWQYKGRCIAKADVSHWKFENLSIAPPVSVLP